jgi:hypothetical protein
MSMSHVVVMSILHGQRRLSFLALTLLGTSVTSASAGQDPVARERLLAASREGEAALGTRPAPAGLDTSGADEDTLFADEPSAAMDVNATTDDRSVGVPTAWWLYTGVTEATVNSLLASSGARLADVEIHSIVSGLPRFTVRMVKNSGAYAVPGWWWYYGKTFREIGSLLGTKNARLIDLEPYDAGGGVIRYAAVMVSNTGPAARAWSYLSGVTSTQITNHINASGHRLIDLDTYFVGSSKYYSAVFVANTGSDFKQWQWWINQSLSGISSRLSSFNGRLVDLERQPDGTWNAVMVKNSGGDAYAWWWVPSFASAAGVVNFANQTASRLVDIETYLVGSTRRYAAVFIDNANADTRRMRSVFGQKFFDSTGAPIGIFEAYLKRAGSAVSVDLNSGRRAETASSFKSIHLLHSMRSVEDGERLSSSFIYYNYPSTVGSGQLKDACPNTADETLANRKTDYNFEKGLDEMMRISDNRTTRGVVLRYGGFSPINTTATAVGLTGTSLRHNIGCAYWNPSTGKFSTSLRNDTTARDLAAVYEGVWNATAVAGTARDEYLESANPGSGVSSRLQTIINEEATKLGKSSSVASEFGSLVRSWGKGGSYGTCLPNSNADCGQLVVIRSGTGLIRFPIQGGIAYRTFAYGHLISDVPVSCFDDPTTALDECPSTTGYITAYSKAAAELFRTQINLALQTW